MNKPERILTWQKGLLLDKQKPKLGVALECLKAGFCLPRKPPLT